MIDNLQRLLEGSNHFELPNSSIAGQDPYSFRCIPQVHGAVRQVASFGKKTVEDECNSTSDNPLFCADQDEVLYCGNPHGESVAMVLDFLSIAVNELSSISERRIYQLLSGRRGLPDYLVENPGVNSGFMTAQCTAAALVNESKLCCTPASVDTIPTCQLQEDHVSMGGTAAYKLLRVIENCEYVLGIELLVAAQACELNGGLRLSVVTQRVFDEVRREVAFLGCDRILSDDIEKSRQLLMSRAASWITDAELS